MAKMKKSSIILLALGIWLGSHVSIYAATAYSYFNTLNLPIEEYVLSTGMRRSIYYDYASMGLYESNCPQGYTTYVIRNNVTGEIVSRTGLYLSNSDMRENKIYYSDDYKNKLGVVYLSGKSGAGYTGYYVEGYWIPDGM